jgi:hypothetical protein
VLVGLAASGPVVEKLTDAPEPMLIALVMSVVRLLFVVVAGVAYVLVTTPFSVRPVPNVPDVWAHRQDEIWLNEPVNLPY